MAAGLPIVATNVVGLPEIVVEGKAGFLVQPRNPTELSLKILDLLQNKDLRRRMSENSRRLVTNYSWENIAERLENILSQISQNSRRQG